MPTEQEVWKHLPEGTNVCVFAGRFIMVWSGQIAKTSKTSGLRIHVSALYYTGQIV